MNLEDFAKEYEKEQKLPESVRGNAPWLKELYGEIQSRPVTATFGAQKKNQLLTDFAKEAESIYRLDLKNRELPTIKEYMRGKYSFTDPKVAKTDTGKEPVNEMSNDAGYSRKSTSSRSLANSDDKRIAIKPKLSDGVSYEKTDTYTKYSSKGETNRNSEISTNFDYNTTLSYSQEYNPNVKLLQSKLQELGYLDMSDGGWGYFGPKTVEAVNAYKRDNDLGNDGKYHGVVGKETWNSLRLLSREQKDIDAGVEIVIIDNKQYYDVTKAVEKAVEKDEGEFEALSKLRFKDPIKWIGNFIKKVSNEGEWNIKNQQNNTWEKTLNISPDTYYGTMIFQNKYVTAEDMGNITFGYLGMAAGLFGSLLKMGSFGYHIYDEVRDGETIKDSIKNVLNNENLLNEFTDHKMIERGIQWYLSTH